jgi:putative peptidoglycan lipid II flippase
MTSSREPSDNAQVTQAAGVVGSATLASRLLGYVRDMVIANLFGAGMVSDAFIAAFRIPNMLRRLMGEGTLSIAFVPVYTDCINRQGRAEADRLAVSALRSLFIILAMIAAVGVALAPALVHLLAYGFTDDPEKYALCVQLTRIMFPYAVFIGMVALCMGVLNVLGHFAAPALAPCLLNLAMIGMVALFSWLSPSPVTRVVGLSIGVLLGGILQLGLQVPFLMRKGLHIWRAAPLWHPAMKEVLLMMGPAMFGAAVFQINTLVSNLLGSLLRQGSISYLYYADRLVQFPLGVFGIAVATAVLPTLSRQAATGQTRALLDTFSHSLRLVFFITLPAMVGLIVLRESIVALLFQRGAFDARSTQLTASALLYYATGLWAFSAVRILTYTFYALKDTRTPVKVAFASIAGNIVLGMVLMRPMQHNGLALAFSLASMLQLILLTAALRKKMGALGWRVLARSAARSGLCALIMGAVVWAAARQILPAEPAGGVLEVLGGMLLCVATGAAVYGALAYLFKAPELGAMKALLGKRTVPE